MFDETNLSTEEFFKTFPKCSKCGLIPCCSKFDENKKVCCCDCKLTKEGTPMNILFQKEVKRQLKLLEIQNDN